jgi:hypothetical protein
MLKTWRAAGGPALAFGILLTPAILALLLASIENIFGGVPSFISGIIVIFNAIVFWQWAKRADGNLSWDGGQYPLNHVVLAGELLYTQSDYIMSLKTPQQVQEIAVALRSITGEEFHRRYFAINPDAYGLPVSDEDFGYTWEWFQGVREFYQRAASAGRYVLFTAYQ